MLLEMAQVMKDKKEHHFTGIINDIFASYPSSCTKYATLKLNEYKLHLEDPEGQEKKKDREGEEGNECVTRMQEKLQAYHTFTSRFPRPERS